MRFASILLAFLFAYAYFPPWRSPVHGGTNTPDGIDSWAQYHHIRSEGQPDYNGTGASAGAGRTERW